VWQQLRQLCCTEEHAAAAMLQLLEAQHARDRAREGLGYAGYSRCQ
jgi:hypothetical protein